MNYDFLIWGNWDPIYLAVAFFAVVIIYIVYKDKLSLENCTNKKFKIFVIGLVLFTLFYLFIYNPWFSITRNLLLLPINIIPSISYTFNIKPFINIVLFIGACLLVFYAFRFLTSKFDSINIFKK